MVNSLRGDCAGTKVSAFWISRAPMFKLRP